MKKLRQQIDTVDAQILKLIAKRKTLAQQVKKYKREHGLPVVIPKREAEVYKSRVALGKRLGLSPTLVKKLMKVIITESRRVQK